MKTHQELIEQGAEQQAAIARREDAYLRRRRRSITRTTIGAGAVSMASAVVMLMAWHEAWWFLLVAPLPGAAAGHVLARFTSGLLPSMLIYTAFQTVYVLIGYRLSGWSFGDAGWEALGALVWTFMFILSWPVIGGYIGFQNDTFEHDHAQI